MADLSVRTIMQDCIGKTGTLSVREDVLGVYGNDNPQDRSVQERLELILDQPFVRVALVTVRPVGSAQGQYNNLQRDLDNADILDPGNRPLLSMMLRYYAKDKGFQFVVLKTEDGPKVETDPACIERARRAAEREAAAGIKRVHLEKATGEVVSA